MCVVTTVPKEEELEYSYHKRIKAYHQASISEVNFMPLKMSLNY